MNKRQWIFLFCFFFPFYFFSFPLFLFYSFSSPYLFLFVLFSLIFYYFDFVIFSFLFLFFLFYFSILFFLLFFFGQKISWAFYLSTVLLWAKTSMAHSNLQSISAKKMLWFLLLCFFFLFVLNGVEALDSLNFELTTKTGFNIEARLVLLIRLWQHR